jgi:hypothetical protein
MTIKHANQKLLRYPAEAGGATILDKIVANKLKEVAVAKKKTSYSQLEETDFLAAKRIHFVNFY